MSEQTPSQPNLAVAKGIALGLGLLLMGGTALLITLLITRGSATQAGESLPPIVIENDETVTDIATNGEMIFLLTQSAGGQQRILLMDTTTGTGTSVQIKTD
ncbi:MAG: hypothetical protein AAF788_02530 [Pseudomonadota bacterium]